MNETQPLWKFGRLMAAGIICLSGWLPLKAQDDEKKSELPPVVEQPDDSTKAAREPDDEDRQNHRHHGQPVVMVGNDFVLKEGEIVDDAVIVSGNATINGHVTGDPDLARVGIHPHFAKLRAEGMDGVLFGFFAGLDRRRKMTPSDCLATITVRSNWIRAARSFPSRTETKPFFSRQFPQFAGAIVHWLLK